MEPTAQHSALATQEMPARRPGDVEPDTDADASVHVEPSQCSMRIPEEVPLPPVVEPEAQQSPELVQASPDRYPPSGAGSVTLGTIVHAAPSQCSIKP